MFRSISSNNDQQPEKKPIVDLRRRVQEGRKLVTYERETGLFAHWYIELRCEEECNRAQRYQRPLTLIVLEPGSSSEAWSVVEQISGALRERQRLSDLPGYLGNGRFVMIAPETDGDGALDVVRRIQEDADVEGGVAAFPQDGLTFEQLYEIAVRRLGSDDHGPREPQPEDATQGSPDPEDGAQREALNPTPFQRIERPDWSQTNDA